jgi:hypothetical protein
MANRDKRTAKRPTYLQNLPYKILPSARQDPITMSPTNSPSKNPSPLKQYLGKPAHNRPKTINAIQTAVADWQGSSLFGSDAANDPAYLPPTFVDDETGQVITGLLDNAGRTQHVVCDPFEEDPDLYRRTPTESSESSPSTPKQKGKARAEDEPLSLPHQDPTSDDIYEDNVPGLSRPKLTLNTSQQQGKGNDKPETSAAGLSKKKALKREDSAALTRLQAIQEALQTPRANVPDNKPRPPTKESSGTGAPRSTSAPDVVEPRIAQRTPQYDFNYHHFAETVADPDSIQQLVRQTVDNPVLHEGFVLYEQTNHIQEHVETLTRRSLELEVKYGDLLFATQNLLTDQQEFNIELRTLSERLGIDARRIVENIPVHIFQPRYPTMFTERYPPVERVPSPRPSTSGSTRPQLRPVPEQEENPRERYGPSNPRWSGQQAHYARHPITGTNEWYSMWRPRTEYKDHQCHYCRLHGHLQWNCPQWACPHCGKACGHKPAKCPKNPRQRETRVSFAQIDPLRPFNPEARPKKKDILQQTINSPTTRTSNRHTIYEDDDSSQEA